MVKPVVVYGSEIWAMTEIRQKITWQIRPSSPERKPGTSEYEETIETRVTFDVIKKSKC
jgi:hypothetical protein